MFLGLGFVAALMAVGAMLLATRDSQEALTGLGVGGAAAAVFTGIGLLKLAQARHAGKKSLGLGAASFVGVMYIAVVFLLVCGFLLPLALERYLGSFTNLISWSLPVLSAAVWLVLQIRKTDLAPARRGLLALAGSYLSLLYIWGLLVSMRWHWLVFGVRVVAHHDSEFFNARLQTMITCMSVAGVAALLFLLTGARILRRAPAMSTWVRSALWWCMSLLVATIACFTADRLVNYWFVVAGVFCLAGALTIGSVLAHFRQPGAVSLGRRAVFTLPLLLLAVPLVTAVSMFGSVFWIWNYYDLHDTHRQDWVWHAPEFLRAPLAEKLAGVNANFEMAIYYQGLVSTADLKKEALALSPKPWRMYGGMLGIGDPVWQAWYERDPQDAFTTAVAVPAQPPGSKLNATCYDFGAGTVIGVAGSDAEIRTRLGGGYSVTYVDGLLESLTPVQRRHFETEIIAYFTKFGGDPMGWNWLERSLPKAAKTVIEAQLQAPSGVNYSSLQISLLGYYGHDDLIDIALHSNDVEVRKIGMKAHEMRFPQNADAAFLRRMLEAAKGLLPNADGDEQRGAASVLTNRCRVPGSLFTLNAVNYVVNTTVSPAPLTASESQNIQSTCNQAETYIQTHFTSPTDK